MKPLSELPITSVSAYSYYTISTVYTAVVLWVLAFRSPELLSLIVHSLVGCFLVIFALFGILSLFVSPTVSVSYMLRRLALITLVIFQLKQALDSDLKMGLRFKNLTNHISLVTGANSGTGFAVAKQLVGLGSTVVLACRSSSNCNAAAAEIKLEYPMKSELVQTMQLDLNDLANVKTFTVEFQKRFKRLDILVNNAGMLADGGEVTVQGLEQSFGVMHVGHFALTRWLLKLLLKPLPNSHHNSYAARVVNIASDAAFTGNFHPTFMEGSAQGDLQGELTSDCGGHATGWLPCCPIGACPNTNGYARAKLSNVLHAFELQRRVDNMIAQYSGSGGISKKFRRLVTSSLHPGSVSTNIHSLFSNPLSKLIARHADDAAFVILHAILDDSFVPTAYIDSMKHSMDLFGFRESRLQQHLQLFPLARDLPFAAPILNPMKLASSNAYDIQMMVWRIKSFIYPVAPAPVSPPTAAATVAGDTKDGDGDDDSAEGSVLQEEGIFSAHEVAARLWDVSEQILSDWAAQKPILTQNVTFYDAPLKL